MKAGRNHPCLCGSGRKYKKCCLAQDKTYRQEQLEVRSRELVSPRVDGELSGRIGAKMNGQPNLTDLDRVAKEANFNQRLIAGIGRFYIAAEIVRPNTSGRYEPVCRANPADNTRNARVDSRASPTKELHRRRRATGLHARQTDFESGKLPSPLRRTWL
jgi:hypothetical protein